MLRSILRDALRLENLPATSSTVVLIASSTVLVVLSLDGSLGQRQLLAAILILLSLYASVAALERLITLTSIKRDIRSLGGTHGQMTRVEGFVQEERFVEGASDVLLIGLNKAGFFLHRVIFFVNLIHAGCTIRVLTLDPSDVELYRVVAANLEVDADRMRTDIRQTYQTLQQIRARLGPKDLPRLQTRRHGVAPGMGITMVNGNKPNGRMQVYFYAYQTDPPYRPGFEIYKETDSEWFRFYQDVAEKLWKDAIPDDSAKE